MKISSEGLYLGVMVFGVLAIIGFLAYLIVPPSIWTILGFMGAGGVFLIIALVLLYVALEISGELEIRDLF